MSSQDKPGRENLSSSREWGLQGDAGGQLPTQLNRARMVYRDGSYQAAIDLLGKLYEEAGPPDLPDRDGVRTRALASAFALEARALVRLGRDARERSRAAAAAFEASITRDASNDLSGEERRDFGIVLYLCGERDAQAREQLTQAIKSGATDAEVYRFLGLTLVRLESFAEAAEALTESLNLEPSHLAALEALVQCLDRQQTSAPVTAAAYFLFAGALFSAGRIEDALVACTRSATLDDSARAETGLGTILAAQGRFEHALEAFDKALGFGAVDTFLLFKKGEVLRLLGRFDESIDLLKRVPDGAAEYVPALGSRGAALSAQKRYDEALATLDLALDRDPKYAFGLAMKGTVLVELNRGDEALEFFRRATAADPELTSTAFQLAEMLRVRERYGESIEVADRLLQQDSKFVEALGTKGASLLELGKLDEAIAVLDDAIKLRPDYVFGLHQKSQALTRADRQAEAVPILRRVLEIDPSLEPPRRDLAQALRSLARNEETLVELNRLLAQNPDDASLIGTKGQTLADLSRVEEAVPLLARAVELDPTLAWAFMSLGDVQRGLGRYQEAIAAYDKVLELTPGDVRTLGMKGDVLFNLERYDEAVQTLDQALAADANDAFSMATKGQVLAAQGQREEAIELLTRAVNLDKDRARQTNEAFALTWALFDLAENLRVVDRLAEAVDVYDDLLSQQPELASAIGGKGSALLGQERYEEALVALDRAIELKPDYAFGLAAKGALLAGCGEFEAAVDPLVRATASDPDMHYAFHVKGFTFRVLGRDTEAEEALLRALEIDPEDLTTRYNLADVYRSTGQPDKATALYEGIVNRPAGGLDPDTTAIVGWCYCRLANYERAVQYLSDSVSRGRLMAHAQFDLGLALLCSDRATLAVGEYNRGIEMAVAEHHPWRRRGLYRLALHDIGIARQELPGAFADSEQTVAIERSLQAEHDRTAGIATRTAANVSA